MKNTGALLKAKRESSNLSLSEVALATKINPKILAAIEEGNDSALPAKTILKGFLKSYALFLKMDVEEVIRTFQEETGPPPPRVSAPSEPVRSEAPPTPRRRMSDDSSTGMRTAAVIVIIVLIGLIIGVREIIEKYQREKIVEQVTDLKASPVETATTPTPLPAPSAGEATATLPAAEPTKPVESKVAETVKPEEKKPEPPPVAGPVAGTPVVTPPLIMAPVAPVVPEERKPEAVAPEPVKPEEKKPEAPVKAAKHEIILEALDKVEVKFQLKGETKRVSLGPTQVHTIHADQPMTIDLSDGGAVNVILDGRERGVPGDLGKPKTIKIP